MSCTRRAFLTAAPGLIVGARLAASQEDLDRHEERHGQEQAEAVDREGPDLEDRGVHGAGQYSRQRIATFRMSPTWRNRVRSEVPP